MIGEPAPAWRVARPLNGTNPGLLAFRGRPLLLLFFDVGSDDCTGRALPFTLDLARRFPKLNIVAVHTALEHSPSAAQVGAVVDQLKLPYLVVLDDGSATFDAYHAQATPHWTLVGADGVVLASISGATPAALHHLEAALRERFPQ